MESHYDCTIENWYLMTGKVNDLAGTFATGDVVKDNKNRWNAGDYCFTSLVVEIIRDELERPTYVRTKSGHKYKLDGEGKEIECGVQALQLAKQGVPVPIALKVETGELKAMTLER